MDYRITVLDFDTGKPVPGATVNFFDYDGQEIITSLVTNSAGYVVLNDEANAVEIDNGGYTAGKTGYQEAARFAGEPLGASETIDIRRAPFKVPALLILGAGAALYAVTASKKKKVSGVAQYTPYLVPAALVTGIGVLVYKIGQKFGLFDDEEDRKQKEQAEQREEEYQQSMQEICQATPTTKATAEWVTITDKLQGCFDYAGYLDSYRDEAVYQLCRAKNDCDVQKLIYYFGHRALLSPFLIRSGDYTLAKAVLERLDRERVDIINNNYARKGIRFSW